LGGLVGDNLGYRPSFWITGALLLLSGLLVVFLVPKDPSPTDATARTRRARSWADLKVLLGSGAALLPLLIARTLYRAAMQVPNPALPLFVQANMPPGTHVATVTGLITGAFAVGSAAGSPLAGNWGDRLGYRRLLLFAGLAAGLFYLPQAFVRLPGWLLVWQLLAGLAIGGALAVLVAMLAHATPKGYEGAVFGLDASAMGVANAIGPMLGASAAAAFGLQIPFALAAATCVISTLLLMVQVGAADLLAPVLKRRAP
ncbi:MAG TPA: MFS transporter, partial [Anaerolineae bacterium]|nr:MFS transporter [Anaerolineae bacterium]